VNSIHDLGGMDGFGPVRSEPDEPPFHETWEGRVLAMQRAMGFTGIWNIDQSRASIEAMAPVEYLTNSYYKKWFIGLEHRLKHHELVGKKLARTFTPADVATMKRGEYARPAPAEPRFSRGDRVHTRNLNPVTHTRLPRYARDKTGTIEFVRGCHVYPDSAAVDGTENPQWLYTVVFTARELWGDDADAAIAVSIEAFEPYLEPA
jgi:nitrile hydratase subunit beta